MPAKEDLNPLNVLWCPHGVCFAAVHWGQKIADPYGVGSCLPLCYLQYKSPIKTAPLCRTGGQKCAAYLDFFS